MAGILVAAGDPGGAAAVLPVMHALRARGFPVATVAGQPAAGMFQHAGFAGAVSSGSWAEHLALAVESIRIYAPELIVVATSMKAGVDAALVRAAREVGLPTVCVLDAWVNYRERFMGPDNGTLRPDAIPDLITVMDDFAVREMVDLGFASKALKVVGQPAFDAWVEQSVSEAWQRVRASARAELRVADGEQLVVFFSQALDVDYGPPGSPRYRGYDQRDVREALERVVADLGGGIRLVVKLHPREPVGAYEQAEAAGRGHTRVVSSLEANALTAAADVVVSMTSITLVQAMLAGVPTISLQPGLIADDANVLGRMGILPPVTDAGELPEAIRGALARAPLDVQSRLPWQWTDGQATARAVEAIEQLVKG